MHLLFSYIKVSLPMKIAPTSQTSNFHKMASSSVILYTLSFHILIQQLYYSSQAIDPTEGFVSLPLNPSNYQIQKPYNIPVDQRYTFKNGVHTFWVFSTDKPLSPASPTSPRTELRILVSSHTICVV